MNYRAEITSAKHLSEALAINAFEYVYAPLEFINADIPEKSRIIVVLPVFLGSNEQVLIENLLKSGVKRVLAHTPGHIELIKNAGLIPHGGFRLNITNSLTLTQYENLGLADGIYSVELPLKNLPARNISMGIMAYGRLPLMIMRRCPIRDSGVLCGKSGCNSLTDRHGNTMQTLCRYSEVEVLNPIPLVLSNRKKSINADFAVLRYTDEDVVHVFNQYEQCGVPSGKYTRGLYFK
jgi:putative protease